jgi:hypothetical protein
VSGGDGGFFVGCQIDIVPAANSVHSVIVVRCCCAEFSPGSRQVLGVGVPGVGCRAVGID